MADSRKQKKARAKPGSSIDLAGGQTINPKNPSNRTTNPKILASKSASTEVQREKVLTLLRQGPKTTLELRLHSILMPSSRIFELKHFHDCIITTELVALYDDQGVRHSKCARYHLVQQSRPQRALDFGSPI